MGSDFRVFLFDELGNPLGELCTDGGTLDSCVRTEELNGEHSLTIETTKHLRVGIRALTRHRDDRWREWVVDEPSEDHSSGDHSIGTYHLCWSLQYDLQTVYHDEVLQMGMNGKASALQCLTNALLGTRRWVAGFCDITAKASSIVMNTNESAWDRMNTVVKKFGGEIDAQIEVNELGVVSRRVDFVRHVGSTTANRRFEWNHDLTSIVRTPDPGPYVCRMIPQGSGVSEETDDGEGSYQVFIEITGCSSYSDAEGIRHDSGARELRDTQSEALFRVSDGNGGYEYPTTVVSFSTDDEDELFELAKADIKYKTRPNVSYTGSVANFAIAGMDTDELAVGDEVQIIDLGFNPEFPLREQERIIKMDVDELGIDDANLYIGQLIPELERSIATIIKTVGTADVSYNAPDWDASKYTVDTPELSTYEVQPVDAEEPYMVDTVENPTVEDQIADLSERVADTEVVLSEGITYDPDEDVYVPSGISADPDVAVGGSGGDGWIHQIDGVTYKTGTINFSTVTGQAIPSITPETPDVDTKESTKDVDWGKKNSKETSSSTSKKSTHSTKNVKDNGEETKKKYDMYIQTATTGTKQTSFDWGSMAGIGGEDDGWNLWNR